MLARYLVAPYLRQACQGMGGFQRAVSGLLLPEIETRRDSAGTWNNSILDGPLRRFSGSTCWSAEVHFCFCSPCMQVQIMEARVVPSG